MLEVVKEVGWKRVVVRWRIALRSGSMDTPISCRSVSPIRLWNEDSVWTAQGHPNFIGYSQPKLGTVNTSRRRFGNVSK
ncbi:hypothetical protein V6N12_061969 [Hibiscus sabdariffa]|uniref:Uncharacterized protein n=1 Tax=Hibiscus sabdariffa TaxID=183260 RepID=A0ABR2DYL1_9ROSI